jgi:ribosomal-protein-alanine N-acetyltransferase
MDQDPVPPSFKIIRVTDYKSVRDLFEIIRNDPSAKNFHPHSFDDQAADDICHYQGQDLYCVGLSDGKAIAYGMLRGWDEGYDIPSLGIYIAPERRGSGIASLFMAKLHKMAHNKGATKIRIKVYLNNVEARQLYENFGYAFTAQEGGQLIGHLNLSGKNQ